MGHQNCPIHKTLNMIYYRKKLIDWENGKGKSDISGDIRSEIESIRSQYFGKNKKNKIVLRYPAGKTTKNSSGFIERPRLLPVQLKSATGEWEWTDTMLGDNTSGGGSGMRKIVKDGKVFLENEIELVWFLKNHCPQFLNGMVYFEDDEEVAKKEATSMFSDIDLKYDLYSKNSSIAKDVDLLKNVAGYFGVAGFESMGMFELRKNIYDKVSSGESRNDKHVNYNTFSKIVSSKPVRRSIDIINRHINNEILVLDKKAGAWVISSGDEVISSILPIKAIDMGSAKDILFDSAAKNLGFRSRLYKALGVNEFELKEELLELGRPELMSLCKDVGIEVSNTSKKEELASEYLKRKSLSQ